MKRILNEQTWKEEGHWLCPDCETPQETSSWMEEEECTNCGNLQVFDTDYINAHEGVISKSYLGPKVR